MMPHKFNTSRRHKFEKKRQKVTNWRVYNEGLLQRGDVTIWLSAEVEDKWLADKRQTPGGQPTYSDMVISVCLTLGMVFKQPLRQTQGLVGSLARLMGLDVPVPDFSTLLRRGAGLSMPEKSKAQRARPIELVLDSTGLKIFGEGEWLQNKHKTKAKRKSWCKLHLGLDITTGDIVCSDLTKDNVGDPTALPELLNQIDAPVSRFLADGAYAGDPTSDLLVDRFGEAIEIVIPPSITAVLSLDAARDPTPRDKHIAEIRDKGRLAWQVSSGYNHRSRGEAQMGCWKMVIGPKLKARNFPNQKTEARIGTNILNKINGLGRAKYEAVA